MKPKNELTKRDQGGVKPIMEITKASFPFQLIIAFAVRMMDTSIANVRRFSSSLFIRIHFIQVANKSNSFGQDCRIICSGQMISVLTRVYYLTVSSGFRQEWYRCKGVVMRIKKNIRTILLNRTVYEILDNFHRDVIHQRFPCTFQELRKLSTLQSSSMIFSGF